MQSPVIWNQFDPQQYQRFLCIWSLRKTMGVNAARQRSMTVFFRYVAKFDIALSVRDVTRVKNRKDRTLIVYLSLLFTTKMRIHKTL